MSEQERMDEGRMKVHEEMDEFERALSRAMRHVEVQAETSAKFFAIAAEAKEHGRRSGRRWFRPASGGRIYVMSRPRAWLQPGWVSGAIAAMLVLGLFAGEQVHARHQREQAALATQQFETATRVTDHALEQVRAQLRQAGLRLE